MQKGKFVNQKLGKNVSRKFDLLKSKLAVPSRASNLPARYNEIPPRKP